MTVALLTALLLAAAQAAPAAPATAAAAPTMDYPTAKLRADADEARIIGQAHTDMVAAQGKLLDAGIAACARDQLQDNFTAFTIVLELDKDGQVQNTWRLGDSPLAVCLQGYVKGKPVLAMPKAPFFMSLEVSFTK